MPPFLRADKDSYAGTWPYRVTNPVKLLIKIAAKRRSSVLGTPLALIFSYKAKI